MKLVILGDPHFGGGYSLGKIDRYSRLNSRLMDHGNTMDHVIDFMVDREASHLVITGDVFEHRRPEASQTAAFSERLARLTDHSIHTHIVVGNHDMIRAHNTTTIDMLRLLRLPNVHVWSEIDSIHCEDPRGKLGINVIFFPFRTRQMLQCATNEKAVGHLIERLRYEVCGVEMPGPKILVGHFALQGAKSHALSMEAHAVSELVLPLSMFKELDATVMGHIHQHQVLSKDPFIAHIGSMERTDFGEAGQPKYFLVVDTDSGEAEYEFHPLPVRPLHDLSIDQAKAEPGNGVMTNIKDEILEYAKSNKMFGSIVRAEVVVNDRAAHDVDTGELMRFLLKDLAVNNCVGVHSTIVAKRQLRNADITERIKPQVAFKKFLEGMDDEQLRKKLEKKGNKIIEETK